MNGAAQEARGSADRPQQARWLPPASDAYCRSHANQHLVLRNLPGVHLAGPSQSPSTQHPSPIHPFIRTCLARRRIHATKASSSIPKLNTNLRQLGTAGAPKLASSHSTPATGNQHPRPFTPRADVETTLLSSTHWPPTCWPCCCYTDRGSHLPFHPSHLNPTDRRATRVPLHSVNTHQTRPSLGLTDQSRRIATSLLNL